MASEVLLMNIMLYLHDIQDQYDRVSANFPASMDQLRKDLTFDSDSYSILVNTGCYQTLTDNLFHQTTRDFRNADKRV